MTNSAGIQAMVMRGGSSKGLYFLASALPADVAARDDILLRVMGTPDPRQIDGMGGAHPLTSKVAIVSRCEHGTADIDYLFLQVGVDNAIVSDRQNCGNLLAGIGPFAVERGLIALDDGVAAARIHMLNSEALAVARFPIDGGLPVYSGDTAISGVPGTAATISLDFQDIAGASCGALLPTGNVVDEIAGVPVTLVDNGMPVVVMRAADVGISGYESCDELEENQSLRDLVEKIRLEAGQQMNLGDVSTATIPKMTIVAPPADGGHLSTRTFIPHRCHQAIGVLGAVSVATAAQLAGSAAAQDVRGAGTDGVITLEHPSGTFDAVVALDLDGDDVRVVRAGIMRTARKLMDGLVYPRSY